MNFSKEAIDFMRSGWIRKRLHGSSRLRTRGAQESAAKPVPEARAQPRETVEYDCGEAVQLEMSQARRRREGLFNEARNYVVIGAPGPEERAASRRSR